MFGGPILRPFRFLRWSLISRLHVSWYRWVEETLRVSLNASMNQSLVKLTVLSAALIVWEERMTQAKILSILSPQALKEQGYGYRIIELQNHLWRQERSVCLGLARVAGRPQDPAVASFLDLISTLQGFGPGPGLAWVVTELHEGKSWRAKGAADTNAPSGPASPVGGLQLGDGGWGSYRPDKTSDFLLMVHPWGSDALVLAQVSNSPTMQAESKGRCGKCDIQCSLCFRSLAPHEIEQEPCFFHPGKFRRGERPRLCC